MSDERPLNVRVAEALGWECLERKIDHGAATRWVGIEPGGSWMWGGCHVPPYGDDTPEGWACTGPLIGRFYLMLLLTDGKWSCLRAAARFGGGEERQGPWTGNPSAAVAEWVAKYGAAAPKEESRGK